jgi:proteic killer suppression protein
LAREVQQAAWKKLAMIHAAGSLQDLLVPPGNRLEKLKGERRDQYSIRVDRRWRICFRWANGNAYDVELVDYH